MKSFLVKAGVVALVLATSGSALAERNFGVGVKAGTLGIGIEGTWRPVPMIDIRLGANRYEYDTTGGYAGINYDATLDFDTLYATANFKFPLSPFRITAGVYSHACNTVVAALSRVYRDSRSGFTLGMFLRRSGQSDAARIAGADRSAR